MAVGGAALVLLGFRRYGLNRPPVLGPTSRLVATGATVFTGYPFLRGALRHCRATEAQALMHSSPLPPSPVSCYGRTWSHSLCCGFST